MDNNFKKYNKSKIDKHDDYLYDYSDSDYYNKKNENTFEVKILDKVNDDKTILFSTSSNSNKALEKTIRRVWRTSHGETLTKESIDENLSFKNDYEHQEFRVFEIEIKEMFKDLNEKYIECWNFLHRLINKMNFSKFKDFFDYSVSDLEWIDENLLINIKTKLFNTVENTFDLTNDQLKILMLETKNEIGEVFLKLNKVYKDFYHFEEKMAAISETNEIDIYKLRKSKRYKKKFHKKLNAKNQKANKSKKVICILLIFFSIWAVLYVGAIVALKWFKIL